MAIVTIIIINIIIKFAPQMMYLLTYQLVVTMTDWRTIEGSLLHVGLASHAAWSSSPPYFVWIFSCITFQSFIHAYMYINDACNFIFTHQYLSKD